MSIWELPMLCPWCMKFAIIEICFKYATFPVVGPTPLPTLISIKSPSFIHVITLPHGVTVCFIKPTHDTYLANERWGEVSWRFWWARSNCYKVTYRHSSAKCCCISMWQQGTTAVILSPWGSQSKTKPICWGWQRGKIKATVGPWGCQALLNNHPETASCQESLSEKTTHLPLKTVQPGFPVTHS